MWTAEEDAKIMEGVSLHGYKWQQIAAVLPGRSANAVRNRFLRCSPEHCETGRPVGAASEVRSLGLVASGNACMSAPVLSDMSSSAISMINGLTMPQTMPLSQGMPMHSEELMVPVSNGQGVNFFWDASALYGEALGSIHDDLFSPQQSNS